jgi:hypothetical protein
MSNRYGQAITWGTASAPHLFAGDCLSYSYDEELIEQLLDNEAGDQEALSAHSHQAQLAYEAEVTSGSTNFLDLSSDAAAIVVSGISTGVVLCSLAEQRWQLGARATCAINATHFMDITQASPVSAGTSNSAFAPSQSGLSIVTPGSTIIYGTYGMGHASGVLHALTISQHLTIQADDPDPDGTIKGAAAFGYLRRFTAEILAKSTIPAVGSTLALTGSPPAMAASNYKILGATPKFVKKKGLMYSLKGVWIPGF